MTPRITAVAGVMLATLPFTASAQQRAVLDEIIVTAQKRAESLQEVPIAISAFDADSLRLSGVASLDDISQRTRG
ncbi:MAG: hypothetical protein EA417_14095 [Gammaproteobacteria bacterium]|nr:MAG: hypothetical protein EA417_14095 [Gammaproteobacteria bacterium]